MRRDVQVLWPVHPRLLRDRPTSRGAYPNSIGDMGSERPSGLRASGSDGSQGETVGCFPLPSVW